jgi:hypothetical protein
MSGPNVDNLVDLAPDDLLEYRSHATLKQVFRRVIRVGDPMAVAHSEVFKAAES